MLKLYGTGALHVGFYSKWHVTRLCIPLLIDIFVFIVLHSCSSLCYKSHQQTHSAASAKQHSPRAERQSPTKLQPASLNTGVKSRSDTSTVMPHLQLLGPINLYNDVRSITSRYPNLRNQLIEIYNATLEAGNEEQYSGRVRARSGHNNGRRTANYRTGTPRRCWTPAEGLSQALHRYRKSKEREDERGDATRAFSGLVFRSNTQTIGMPRVRFKGPAAQ